MDPIELMSPRILVVDDERQIFASLRLRLGQKNDLLYCSDAALGLEAVRKQRFDLCFVDLHMPQTDGFAFIESAREVDPGLGYVIISAFDNPSNLRRSIPLQVFDFISKPLPEKDGFENRVPDWVSRARRQRRDSELARQAATLETNLDAARLESEIELLAAENARDTLLHAAGQLTTIHAHLVTATALLGTRKTSDPASAQLARNVDEARRSADAARSATEEFFSSAYANREHAPAMVNRCLKDAIALAVRQSGAAATNTVVDFDGLSSALSLSTVSGMEFLSMIVPLFTCVLRLAPANSTVRVTAEMTPRLETCLKDPVTRDFLWLNRANASSGQPGVVIGLHVNFPAMEPQEIEAWLKGSRSALPPLPVQSLLSGIKHGKGLLGFAVAPMTNQFRIILSLPT